MTASNDLSGSVAGSAVQARDIHGGVHLHGVRAGPPVPRQLLPAPPGFVGRAEQLAALDRVLAPDGPPLVVLSGPGGAGKTALATIWAHRVAGRFPDGQLYVDLGAFGAAGPVEPADALAGLLRALGVPARLVPAAPAEQAALYRSLTARRAVLVVLDDAASATQVRALVPASPASRVVVTSRRRLPGLVPDGARLVEVGPLPAADAEALLVRAVGAERAAREPGATAELAALCGGLPIALSVAAARLVVRPALSVRGAVADLAAAADRLHELAVPGGVPVRAVLDTSYRALDPSAAALYRRLALHPGRDFGSGVVAALTADPGALDRLADANLVEETAEDRFRFHVLARLHARRCAAGDEPLGAARLAILEWYLAAAAAADRLLTPHRRRLPYRAGVPAVPVPAFDGRASALAWLERERGNLVAATADAAAIGRPELAWHLAYALWPLFLYGKHYRDRLTVDGIGVDAALAWGEPWAEAVMLKRLGRSCAATGDLTAAFLHTEAAMARYGEIGDRTGQTDAAEGLAGMHREAGDSDTAAALYAEVLAVRREFGEPRATALTLINVGTLLTALGRPDRAVPVLREAGDLLAGLAAPDPHNAARAAVALAGAPSVRVMVDRTGGRVEAVDAD
ncbi:tetratricopeptide repeat protein, partial [Dactylosporangium sp. NPDC005572]|uniref:ATP-binding protein n=1 Tax=Dactylosporangium sp. NPDC005572 TaxID=3156889 RepID=UPI0033ACD682